MFNVDLNGRIYISRGDTGFTTLYLSQLLNKLLIRYKMKEGDEVYLGVFEPNSVFEDSIIKKRFYFKDLNEDGDLIVKFKPRDTLNILPGLYYYQVKLRVLCEESENKTWDFSTEPDLERVGDIFEIEDNDDDDDNYDDELDEDDEEIKIIKTYKKKRRKIIYKPEKDTEEYEYEVHTVVEATQFWVY